VGVLQAPSPAGSQPMHILIPFVSVFAFRMAIRHCLFLRRLGARSGFHGGSGRACERRSFQLRLHGLL